MLARPLTGWCMSLLLFRTQKGLWRPLGPLPSGDSESPSLCYQSLPVVFEFFQSKQLREDCDQNQTY
jgi:hypothetical protein